MSSPSVAEGGGASLAAGLLAEAHPRKILPSLFAGLVIGLSGIVTGIGVAALAFPGPLQEHVFAAVGVVLFGAMVMLVVTSLTSSRSEEHTSELQSLMRISYAAFCLKKKTI